MRSVTVLQPLSFDEIPPTEDDEVPSPEPKTTFIVRPAPPAPPLGVRPDFIPPTDLLARSRPPA